MKRYIVLLVLFALLSCENNEKSKSEMIQFIAPDAALVLKFEDFPKWQNDTKEQSFIAQHQDDEFFKTWTIKNWESVIDIPEKLILTYNILGNNNLIETLIFEKQKTSNIKLESKQSYTYDQIDIQTYESDNKTYYKSELGEYVIMCTSKIILENIIRNYKSDIKIPQPISKLMDVLSDNTPSLVVDTSKFSDVSKAFFKRKFPESFLNLSNYIGFDLNFNQKTILFSGIVFKPENKSPYWSNFAKVSSENSLVAEVIPNNFVSAKSLLISDYQKLFSTRENVNNTPVNDSLWFNIKELAEINLTNTRALALVSKNIDQTFEALEKNAVVLKTFGAFQIYKHKENLSIGSEFKAFITPQKIQYFVVFQDIIISSNQLQSLEDIIIQINNQNVLAKQANYKNHLESLNTKSHILWFTNMTQQNGFFENQTQDTYKEDFQNIKWNENELLVSQMIVEDDFAYLNILQKRTKNNSNQVDIKQVIRLKAENKMLTKPQFFENWRTGQHDVVYQDAENILYLKDTKGNLIWSKTLDSPIVGKISNIDIYQNTRIQLAFATQHKVYILDKNGNDVSPFPLEFKDEITQGLSVFDYDKNGKYRFVVVMGDKVRMYDKTGKRVRGFKFTDTKTPVSFPLKHIRMNNRDYILAQEESGVLQILNRRGDNRVEIDDSFRHEGYQWFEHQNNFVSVTEKGEILKIDHNANLTREDKGWINPKFSANADIFVSMSENELQINNSEIELPYGVYTKPIITKNHIGIADTQAQKIYVFNTKAEMLEGFPVYGQRITDIYTTQNTLVLLCQDEDKAALVYRVKFD